MAWQPDCVVTTWELNRSGLRWTVVCRTAFPVGVAGVAVRPFMHPERSFWRRSRAAAYAEARAWGRIAYPTPQI